MRGLVALLLLLPGGMLGGCAVQAPVSEALVFAPNPRPLPEASAPLGVVPVEIGLPLSVTAPAPSITEEATGDPEAVIHSGWRTWLPSPAFAFRPAERVVVAFSPGIGIAGLGLDATAQVAGPYYVTASVNNALNVQVIAQRRVLAYQGGGVSLGVTVRRERFDVGEVPDGEDIFAVPSVGGRVAVQTPVFGPNPLISESPFRLRGFVSAGYAWTYDAPVASAGIVLSVPSSR